MHMGFETEVTKYCVLCHATEKAKLFVSLNEMWFDNDKEFGADVENGSDGKGLSVKCERCGSMHTILLDPKMGDVVAALNQKGYKTAYSCDGFESEHQIDLPYISFDAKTTPSDIFNSLPYRWGVSNDADFDKACMDNTVSIYYNEYGEYDDSIDWDVKDMLEWVDKLPYNDLNEDKIVKMPGERYVLYDIKQAFENIGHQVSDLHVCQVKGQWIVLVEFLDAVPSIFITNMTRVDDNTLVIPLDDIYTDSIYQLVAQIDNSHKYA